MWRCLHKSVSSADSAPRRCRRVALGRGHGGKIRGNWSGDPSHPSGLGGENWGRDGHPSGPLAADENSYGEPCGNGKGRATRTEPFAHPPRTPLMSQAYRGRRATWVEFTRQITHPRRVGRLGSLIVYPPTRQSPTRSVLVYHQRLPSCKDPIIGGADPALTADIMARAGYPQLT
jgi:hypothetical protein